MAPVVVFLQTKFTAPHIKAGKQLSCDWKAYYVLDFDDRADRIFLTIRQPLSQPEDAETFQQEVDSWLGPFAKELRVELTARSGVEGPAAVHDVAAEDVVVLTPVNGPPASSLADRLKTEMTGHHIAPAVPLQTREDCTAVHKALWSPETVGCSVEVNPTSLYFMTSQNACVGCNLRLGILISCTPFQLTDPTEMISGELRPSLGVDNGLSHLEFAPDCHCCSSFCNCNCRVRKWAFPFC